MGKAHTVCRPRAANPHYYMTPR